MLSLKSHYHAISQIPFNVFKNVLCLLHYPNLSYDDSLALSGIAKLSSRREEACLESF